LKYKLSKETLTILCSGLVDSGTNSAKKLLPFFAQYWSVLGTDLSMNHNQN